MTNGMIGPARWCRSLLVAGCVALSWPVLDAARSPAPAAEQIKIGISRTISDAGYYIADAMGFFREEGIDVSILGFNSAAQMIAPLGTGELDVGGGTVSAGFYNAVGRGILIKIVADQASIKLLDGSPSSTAREVASQLAFASAIVNNLVWLRMTAMKGPAECRELAARLADDYGRFWLDMASAAAGTCSAYDLIMLLKEDSRPQAPTARNPPAIKMLPRYAAMITPLSGSPK